MLFCKINFLPIHHFLFIPFCDFSPTSVKKMAPKDYLGRDQRNVANDKEKKVDDIKGT